ncbi:MAG: dTDP-4-dehydrorhamnose 3,5-epimerase [Bradyrhizobium sp.]|nr:MAG: dTDP-4-dehydrorhamnose 3,5-epimerase [Bradyrhizobium sp.]
MRVENTALADVKIVTPKRFDDPRGFFSEVYNEAAWRAAGLPHHFVQDNHSLSLTAGTIRGLHFQLAPHAQIKLVRVTRGRVLDVAVDLRRSSPSFGRHVAIELSDENWTQLLAPVGFAHGFCTLSENAEVLYKVSDFHSPAHDRGLAWDDPDLAIAWPIRPAQAVLSEKDRNWPRLRDLAELFP